MSKPASMRVDRLLGSMGYGSRTEMARLAKAGGVVLDGVDLTDVSKRIAVTPDLPSRMQIDGQPLDPPPGLVLMLHKPLGMTCSHKEDGALVYDVLPDRWRRRDPAISTIGRLDKATTGLLLLTDDGDLLHRVISPKRHVAKVYRAGLARPLAGTEAELFSAGGLVLEGEDKPLAPAALEVLSPTEARLTVTEGRVEGFGGSQAADLGEGHAANMASISPGSSRRHSPGARSSGTDRPPMRSRWRVSTWLPTAANMRRTMW